MNTIDEQEAQGASRKIALLSENLNALIFGQEQLVEALITGLVARGHVLLEGLPGLGKTELIKGLARSIGLGVRRIQFTPDLLPGDITGTPILQDSGDGRRFVFEPGPVFTNLLLADEINRASPKTQSALLEAMQERRVTVMGQSHPLPSPFFVLATQNPIELEGTYPLPEAQLDRFLFKLEVESIPAEVLQRIVSERALGVEPTVETVLTPEDLDALLSLTPRVYLPDVVANYIARLVAGTHPGSTRASRGVKFGASPRAALGLAAAARARALSSGRINAGFEDVRSVAPHVLRHRIIMDYTARVEGRAPSHVIAEILSEVPMDATDIAPVMTDSTRGLHS